MMFRRRGESVSLRVRRMSNSVARKRLRPLATAIPRRKAPISLATAVRSQIGVSAPDATPAG